MKYEVTMQHLMRACLEVEAASPEEAKELAYAESFAADEPCWEEINTAYVSVREVAG